MKKLMSGLAIAVVASTALMGAASAQRTETASSGNGGVVNANSNGGGVQIGDANTGGDEGGTTSTGNSSGGTISLAGADLAGLVGEGDLAQTIIEAVLGTGTGE